MKKQDRRNFLFAGLSLAALWASVRFIKQPAPKKTKKFLTEDGTLVEIDIDKLPGKKVAATKSDIQHWVKKNKQL